MANIDEARKQLAIKQAKAELDRRKEVAAVDERGFVEKALQFGKDVFSEVTSDKVKKTPKELLELSAKTKPKKEGVLTAITAPERFITAAQSAAVGELESQALGLAQGISRIGEFLGFDVETLEQNLLARDIEVQERQERAAEISPSGKVAGQIAGFVGPGFTLGPLAKVGAKVGSKLAAKIPVIGRSKIAQSTAGQFAAGGAVAAPFAAAQITPEGESKLAQTALGIGAGAVAGGAVAGVGTAIGQGAKALFGAKPAQTLAGPLTKQEARQAQKVARSAEELGVSKVVSPGAASGSQRLAAIEARTPISGEAQDILSRQLSTGEQKLQSEIRKFTNKLVPEGDVNLKRLVDEGYDNVLPIEIPAKQFDKISKSRVIQNSLDEIKTLPESEELLKALPENSLGQLDAVQRNLKDKIDELFKAGKSNRANAISNIRDQLVNELDKIAPAYAETRKLAQRQINKKKLFDEIAKIKFVGDEPQSSQFFKKFLSSPKARKETLQLFKGDKGARDTVVHLTRVLAAIEKSPLKKLVLKGEKRGGDASGRVIDFVKDAFGSARNEDFIELITSGNWTEQIKKVASLPDNQKLGGLTVLLEAVRTSARTLPPAAVGELTGP